MGRNWIIPEDAEKPVDARIEFKETWNAKASLKTICAFANDIDNWGGGYIVIGVREKDGRPEYPLQGIPVEKVEGYLKDMLNRCKRIHYIRKMSSTIMPSEEEKRFLRVRFISS